MNNKIFAFFLIFLIGFPFAFAVPTTIHTSNTGQASGWAGERAKIVHDGEKYWAFYVDAGELYYEPSVDGHTWDNSRASVGTVDAQDYSVYIDGSTVYTFRDKPTNQPIFRKGTISGNTISWDSEVDFGTAIGGGVHGVVKLTDGRLLVTWNEQAEARDDFSNSTDDGLTWFACSAIVSKRAIGDNGGGCGHAGGPDMGPSGNDAILLALADGKAVHIGTLWGAGFGYAIWNSSHWLPSVELNITLDAGAGSSFSAVADADQIDIIARNSSQYIFHRQGFALSNSITWNNWEEIAGPMSGNDKGVSIGYTVDAEVVAAWPASTQTSTNRSLIYREHSRAADSWGSPAIFDYEDSGSITNTTLSLETKAATSRMHLVWTLQENGTNYVRISNITAGSVTTPDVETVEIPDLDFDPIMFVDKFYDVQQTVTWDGKSVDTMRTRFSDEYVNIYLTYDNQTETFSSEVLRISDDEVMADYVVLDTQHSYVVETIAGTLNTIEAHYLLKLSIRVQDALGVDVYQWNNATDGSVTGWTAAQLDYFDIYNHGGWIEWAASGDGGRITGGDAFEMWGRNGSSVEVNQTWYHLEHYHAQFSLRHSENGTGEDNYWQDNAHIVPGEKWSDKGDWQLEIGWFYFDPVDKVYVEGCNGLIMMEEGDVGTDDLWVNLNVTWSDATGSVAGSEIMTAFVEREDESKVRLWTDVWFNKMNASTVLGCRVSSYYYGIVNTANWLWPNWRPLIENSSESMNFGRTLDNDGDITPSQFLELVKVSFNLTRPSYNDTSPNVNFMTEIRDFDISEFNLALSDIVDGVNTPIFVDTKVPDLPVNSFLAPIYAALMMIGDTIMGALAYAQEWIWNGIRERWPWFTDFWENSLETIYSLGEIFTIMWTHMTNLFSFLVDLFGYVTYPIQVIQNAWATVQAAFTWIDGLNLRDLIVVVLLVLIFVPVIGAVTAGDWGYLFKMAQVTWRIIYALFDIFYRFVTFVINAILSLIPL